MLTHPGSPFNMLTPLCGESMTPVGLFSKKR